MWRKPFCDLIHFKRHLPAGVDKGPRILIVAPMSGHYATLLRGTVEALMQSADVYITDWIDARMVPVTEGDFDLDDYIDYVIDILHHLGPDTHVVAVCQPSVPVLAAVAVMEGDQDSCAPSSMTLMGGPIDTRINPTAVNQLAQDKPLEWFRDNVIMQVPWPQPGFMRNVYPGFLQLSGFMSMNLDRHMIAHKDFYMHLVKNDGDSAEKHRDFYDEYLAVMDLTAEFYLQTVDTVFIKHSLPKGEMMHRTKRVDTTAIRNVALLTVEGENDDISGVGQTKARRPSARTSPTICACITCSPMSVTTGSSMARASAAKSRRGSSSSPRPTARRPRPQRRSSASSRVANPSDIFVIPNLTSGFNRFSDWVRFFLEGQAAISHIETIGGHSALRAKRGYR